MRQMTTPARNHLRQKRGIEIRHAEIIDLHQTTICLERNLLRVAGMGNPCRVENHIGDAALAADVFDRPFHLIPVRDINGKVRMSRFPFQRGNRLLQQRLAARQKPQPRARP